MIQGETRDRRGQGERHRHQRDQGLGHGEAHHLGDVLDVAGGAGQQVAGAGVLDGAEGQGEHAVEELLAQLGQDPLAEHVGGQAGHPHQHDLGDQGGQHGQGDPVDVPGGGGPGDLVDQQAEQGGAGQPGHGGRGVQADGQRQRPAVAPRHRPGPGPDLGGGRHREPAGRGRAGGRRGAACVRAHGSSPLATTAR